MNLRWQDNGSAVTHVYDFETNVDTVVRNMRFPGPFTKIVQQYVPEGPQSSLIDPITHTMTSIVDDSVLLYTARGIMSGSDLCEMFLPGICTISEYMVTADYQTMRPSVMPGFVDHRIMTDKGGHIDIIPLPKDLVVFSHVVAGENIYTIDNSIYHADMRVGAGFSAIYDGKVATVRARSRMLSDYIIKIMRITRERKLDLVLCDLRWTSDMAATFPHPDFGIGEWIMSIAV